MSHIQKLISLLNKLNKTNSRYEAEFDVYKKNVKAKVTRNDDLVVILNIDTERDDKDYTIEINASIAYLEALICESSEKPINSYLEVVKKENKNEFSITREWIPTNKELINHEMFNGFICFFVEKQNIKASQEEWDRRLDMTVGYFDKRNIDREMEKYRKAKEKEKEKEKIIKNRGSEDA